MLPDGYKEQAAMLRSHAFIIPQCVASYCPFDNQLFLSFFLHTAALSVLLPSPDLINPNPKAAAAASALSISFNPSSPFCALSQHVSLGRVVCLGGR